MPHFPRKSLYFVIIVTFFNKKHFEIKNIGFCNKKPDTLCDKHVSPFVTKCQNENMKAQPLLNF